jgi:hypothetical protein
MLLVFIQILFQVFCNEMVNGAVMSCPIRFMFRLICTSFHGTFERSRFVFQISKKFFFEMVGHVLNFQHCPILPLKLFSTNFANFWTSLCTCRSQRHLNLRLSVFLIRLFHIWQELLRRRRKHFRFLFSCKREQKAVGVHSRRRRWHD